jgi:hypothetical protein
VNQQRTLTFGHDAIRASVWARQGGVVISIRVADGQTWREVVKVDAFGMPHWHLYTRHGGQDVYRLEGGGLLHGGRSILEELPTHLIAAGHPEAADHLCERGHLQQFLADIDRTAKSVTE